MPTGIAQRLQTDFLHLFPLILKIGDFREKVVDVLEPLFPLLLLLLGGFHAAQLLSLLLYPLMDDTQSGRMLFGAHPYAQPGDGLGDAASIKAMTPAALRAAHEKWLRPDMARITVAGDVTMAQLLPLLETAFGNWKPPAVSRRRRRTESSPPAACRNR